MVVEELVARLGFKGTGANEAARFLKQLEQIKRAMKDLGKGSNFKVGGTNGLSRAIRDMDRMSAAARRYRQEMERASRVRGPRGPGAMPGGGGWGAGAGYGYGGSRYHTRRPRASATRHGESVPDAVSVGLTGRQMGAAAVAVGGASAAKSATTKSMDFERAMIRVENATDAGGQELKGFSKYVIDLSRATGREAKGLADMLAEAGFAGRPKEELKQFVDFGAKVATAWDGMELGEAGDKLAKLANNFTANQTRLEQMSDAINKAADTSATKEPALLEFLSRTGATMNDAKMKLEQGLPFATGVMSTGMEPEVAATTFETMMNVLKLGADFSKSAEDGLKAAGINPKQMQKDFVKDPTSAAVKMLEAFGKIKDPIKRATALTDTFGTGFQDNMQRVIGQLEATKEMLKTLGDPANYTGDVRNKFNKQLSTDTSKIDRGQRAAEALQLEGGDTLKGILADMSSAFSDVVERYRSGAGVIDRFTAAVQGFISGLGFGDDKKSDEPGMFGKAKAAFGAAGSAAVDYLMGEKGKREADLKASSAFGYRAGQEVGGYPVSRDRFDQMLNASRPAFGKTTDRMNWQRSQGASAPAFGKASTAGMTPPSFGSVGQRQNWMQQPGQQAAQQTIEKHIHNTDVGNDHRTQSVHISQTVNDQAGVAAAAAAGAKAALSSMGASIVKGGTAATGSDTAP